jgi:hypothetical protein
LDDLGTSASAGVHSKDLASGTILYGDGVLTRLGLEIHRKWVRCVYEVRDKIVVHLHSEYSPPHFQAQRPSPFPTGDCGRQALPYVVASYR